MTEAEAANKDREPHELPVTVLPGVGPERAALLAKLDIGSVEDLLLHRPRRHEDRRNFRSIEQMQVGVPVLVRGTVVAAGIKWFRYRTKSIVEVVLQDGTGRLHCRWWNLPFMEKYFKTGDELLVSGKPLKLKPRTMDHPEIEVVESGEENFIHLNRITPVYPLTEGLPQRWLRALIWRTLQQYEKVIPEQWQWPDSISRPANHMPRRTAIHRLHFPDEFEEVEEARRRLALDEFIELQRKLLSRRKNFEAKADALPCGGDNRLMQPFLARLGFKLTEAQTTVLRELRKDMSGRHPMRRLLQGDVGSGKTVVAACCGIMALESGYNVAVMAPTEILAEQHFHVFTQWLTPLGIPVHLQTGTHKAEFGEQSLLPGSLAAERSHEENPPRTSGKAGLFVGTHALLSAGFELPNLGLAIIDEQQKFGVLQRERLVRKGRYPHLLVMTATPIPRTLGLTLYGELDLSTISEMPSGRGKIKTFVRTEEKLPKVWEFIRKQLAAGRQAYVVYPRVEETSQGIKAVTKEFEILKQTLAPFQVGLMHGRLKTREKELVMSQFRRNTVQVLLATALVEVGMDVSNANTMLIENAEQFGLAQLHQLRGRIGRGAHDSYCILIASTKENQGQERLQVLERSANGFEIAEADLELRGPGELLGQEQSGEAKFRFGNLKTDWQLIVQARQIVSQWPGEMFAHETH